MEINETHNHDELIDLVQKQLELYGLEAIASDFAGDWDSLAQDILDKVVVPEHHADQAESLVNFLRDAAERWNELASWNV